MNKKNPNVVRNNKLNISLSADENEILSEIIKYFKKSKAQILIDGLHEIKKIKEIEMKNQSEMFNIGEEQP